MSNFETTPFKPSPRLLVAGKAQYVRGSWNDKTPPTAGNVISTSGNGTTSTVIVQIREGNVPIVGALLTIVGTTRAAGAYNVTNVAIASVSSTDNFTSGVVTITFLGTGNSVVAADGGQFQIPQPEIGETFANGASVPVAVAANNPIVNQARTVTVVVSCPSLPTAATVKLQGAVNDIDSEYADLGTVGTVAGGILTVNQATVTLVNERFLRLNNSAVSGGTLPTLVGKILG